MDKIRALTAALYVALLLTWAMFAPVPAGAQTVSTANYAFPLPVNTTPWNTITTMGSSTYATYALTGNAARSLATVTGGFIPAGTKILTVYAASGTFTYGNSTVLTSTSGKYPTVAESSSVDIPCDPLSPNSGVAYFCNGATDTASLLRFFPKK